MKPTTWITVMLVVALPLLAGCQQQRTTAEREMEVERPAEAPPTTTEQEIPGMQDTSPIEAQIWIDDVTIGHQVAPDGAIPAAQTGDEFTPGQAIYVAMTVTDAPVGAAVKVAVIGANEARVFENEKPVEAGAEHLSFAIEDTATWPVGDYRLEVWTGDEQVATQQFQIVEQAAAPQ